MRTNEISNMESDLMEVLNSSHIDSKQSNRINSFQALRCIAFLGIFLLHSGFFIEWAKLGVSIFFVMSGFLTMRKHGNEMNIECAKKGIDFAKYKIGKLYSLHIATMVAMLFLEVVSCFVLRKGLVFLKNLCLELIMNIFLIQTWYPNQDVNMSLNGVAWFLSTSMFLYFLFPFLAEIVRKNSVRKLVVIISLLFIFEIIICTCFISLFGEESKIYIWFMYAFPPFRIIDFLSGCCLQKFIENNNSQLSIKVSTNIRELIVVAITMVLFLFLGIDSNNIIIKATQNWTSVYVIIALLWISEFYYGNGFLHSILVNRVTVFLGDLSSNMFLIHYVVTQYFNYFIAFLKVNKTFYVSFFIVLIELLMTIVISVLYNIYINHKKRKVE